MLFSKKKDGTSMAALASAHHVSFDDIEAPPIWPNQALKGLVGREFIGCRIIFDKKTQHRLKTQVCIILHVHIVMSSYIKYFFYNRNRLMYVLIRYHFFNNMMLHYFEE